MQIQGYGAIPNAISPIKNNLLAKNVNEGVALVDEEGKFDVLELSKEAHEKTKNATTKEIEHSTFEKITRESIATRHGVDPSLIFTSNVMDVTEANFEGSEAQYGDTHGSLVYEVAGGKDVLDSLSYDEMKKHVMDVSMFILEEFIGKNKHTSVETNDPNFSLEVTKRDKVSFNEFKRKFETELNEVMSILQNKQEEYPSLYNIHFASK